MPLYELKCTECKKVTEEIFSFKLFIELLEKKYKFSCPSCGGRGYEKLPSKVAKAVVK